MHHLTSLPVFLTAVGLLSVAPLQASLIVSQSATAPSANILAAAPSVASTGLNWNGFAGGDTAHRDVAQTFSVTSNWNVDSISLHLKSFGAQAQEASFTLSILQIPTTSTSPADGVLLTSFSDKLPQTLIAEQYITFAFTTPVLLEGGYNYAFVLHFDERGGNTGSTTRRTVIFSYGDYTNATNPLGSGFNGTYSNNPFTSYINTNTPFATYLTGTASIPEPSTILLGVAGAALLTCCLKSK